MQILSRLFHALCRSHVAISHVNHLINLLLLERSRSIKRVLEKLQTSKVFQALRSIHKLKELY